LGSIACFKVNTDTAGLSTSTSNVEASERRTPTFIVVRGGA